MPPPKRIRGRPHINRGIMRRPGEHQNMIHRVHCRVGPEIIRFARNIHNYDYYEQNFKDTLELQQDESLDYGNILKSKDEKRILVENIDACKNDPNSIIGSQGQVMANFGAQRYVFGTGLMIVLTRGEETKQFVLTSSQNFKRIDSANNSTLSAISATFSLGKHIESDGRFKIDAQIALTQYYDDPEYNSNRFQFAPFSDIALALCDDNFKIDTNIEVKNIPLIDCYHAKPGDRICIAGYPAEYNGRLYYMEGTLHGIYREWKGYAPAIITYNDINVTHGMNGSPVYLWYKKSWAVIGVHVAYDKKNNLNIAAGLTRLKLRRLVALADSHFSKPIKNLIFSPRVRLIGRENSVNVPGYVFGSQNNDKKYILRAVLGKMTTTFMGGLKLGGGAMLLNLSDGVSEKYFALTSANLFSYYDEDPETAVFSDTSNETYLKEYFVYPKFADHEGLAFARCEPHNLTIALEEVKFESVDIVKESDSIRLFMFPETHVKRLCYCQGTISRVSYKDNNQVARITYEMPTNRKMNGMPLFFKKNDGTWSIIGVQNQIHMSGDIFAVGFTKSSLAWINEIAMA